MILKILLFVYLFISLSSFGQNKIEGTSYTHFQLKLKKDTIDFVIADTNLQQSKPLLLFCQGSQPVPLFINFEGNDIFPVPLNNFDVKKLNEKYHVCVISMPKTPISVSKKQLNNQYCYITDTSYQYSFSKDYLNADYFENYVKRANKVLKYLLKQNWIESDKVVVAGHSQGARVAVGIASSNKKVTHLGLFGYNPNGRIDQSIRQTRKDAEAGKISWEEADSLQQERYDFYAFIQNEEASKDYSYLAAWKSFSKPTLNLLTNLKIPVYIAYGSADVIADYCDLLPLCFIENGKKNYSIKRYPNLNHNFFPLDQNGKAIHSEKNWKNVFDEFINWIFNAEQIH